MSTHIPVEEIVASEDNQRHINKCVQQLVNRAAPNTVLQAQKKCFGLSVGITAISLRKSWVSFRQSKNCALPPLLGYVWGVVSDAMDDLISH